MRLDQLPKELLVCLPEYLHSLDDLYSLLRVSRVFYDCCANTRASLRPLFAKRHGQRLFAPHPHLLIAGAARSVADWAILDKANEYTLRRALKGGIDGLFELCCCEGRITLSEARALTAAKYDLLNPVTKLMDNKIGPAKREREYAASGHTLDDDTEWWTICEYPDLALLNHWIYCELFHHDVDAAVDPSSNPKKFALKTRILFCRYCMPDCNDKIGSVPEAIWEQAYAYSSGPWDTARHGTRLGCYMMIQEKLYNEDDTSFCRSGIAALLGDRTIREETTIDYEHIQAKLNSVGRRLLYNVILHKPLLIFRLLVDGGSAAVADSVRVLAEQCNKPAATSIFVEAVRINDQTDEPAELDLYSDEEDAIAVRTTRYGQDPDTGGFVRLDPPQTTEEKIQSWRWTGIEQDIREIIWNG